MLGGNSRLPRALHRSCRQRSLTSVVRPLDHTTCSRSSKRFSVTRQPIGRALSPIRFWESCAQDIVRSLPEFEQSVSAFLAEEARSVKHLTRFADEIRQLTIEDVCLFWPHRSDDGMIYFKGPDEFRVWRCDYVARKPQGLGFDS